MHKRAGVATNQSTVSGWIWSNESDPVWLLAVELYRGGDITGSRARLVPGLPSLQAHCLWLSSTCRTLTQNRVGHSSGSRLTESHSDRWTGTERIYYLISTNQSTVSRQSQPMRVVHSEHTLPVWKAVIMLPFQILLIITIMNSITRHIWA